MFFFRFPNAVAGLLAVALLALAVPAAAGAGPSDETCKQIGWLDVTCFVCATGEKFGMVSVEAAYDAEYNDCGKNYNEARRRCANYYSKDYNTTGVKWSQTIAGTIYDGWAPNDCKH